MNPQMTEWVNDKLEKMPAADTFKLYHMTINDFGGGALLDSYAVGDVGDERDGFEAEVEKIVLAMHTAARMHVESFDGQRQRYQVVAEADDDMMGTFPFALGAKMQSSQTMMSEPVNERGLLGQLMRHNESLVRQNTDMVQAVVGPLIAENQALRRQRDGWEEKRLEYHLKLESLTSEEHVRDLELRRYEDEEGRKKKAIEMVLKYGPEILRQISANGKRQLSATTDSPVAEQQAILLQIFRLLNKGPIYAVLDEDQQRTLDNLLGIGQEDPKSEEVFRRQLITLWGALPVEVTDAMTRAISEKDPLLLARFAALMGIEDEEEGQEGEESGKGAGASTE